MIKKLFDSPPIHFDSYSGTFHVKSTDILQSTKGQYLINEISNLDLTKTTQK